MLVVTRKVGESVKVLIGNGRIVTIKVFKSNRKQVRLGIKAPSDIKVLRGELEEVRDVG